MKENNKYMKNNYTGEIAEIKNEIAEVKTKNILLEGISQKLAQSIGITTEALLDLTGAISDVVKSQVKDEIVTAKKEMRTDVIKTVSGKIEETVKTEIGKRGLNEREIKVLTDRRNKKIRQFCGDTRSDFYKLFSHFYQWILCKEYKDEFECTTYGGVDANRFDEAIEFITNFTVKSDFQNWCVKSVHKNYNDREITDPKKLNAYKRYFGLQDVG